MTRTAPRTPRMAAALTALALGATACGTDLGDLADTETVAVEEDDAQAETAEAPAETDEPVEPEAPDATEPPPATEEAPAPEAPEDAPATEEAPTDEATEEPESDLQVDADDGADTNAGPGPFQDLDLDLTDRNPNGTTMTVDGIRFEDNAIILDAAINNGFGQEVTIRANSNFSDRIRLVDDVGNEYNFRAPDDDDLHLEPGEVIAGEFVFLGPPQLDATELTVIANINEWDPEAFDPDDRTEGSIYPELVVRPIPLEAS